MSETVKLIIEIPKEVKQEFDKTESIALKGAYFDLDGIIGKAIQNGIPLDSNSERAEVQAYFDGQAYGWEQGRKALIEDAKAEIEKCKEVANVPYDKDYLTTVWAYDDAIRVLDRIGKGDSE